MRSVRIGQLSTQASSRAFPHLSTFFRHHADLLGEGDVARVVLVGAQERILQQRIWSFERFSPPKSDDQPANNNQGSANKNWQVRQRSEKREIDKLPNDKECCDVESDHLSKFDWSNSFRRVKRVSDEPKQRGSQGCGGQLAFVWYRKEFPQCSNGTVEAIYNRGSVAGNS